MKRGLICLIVFALVFFSGCVDTQPIEETEFTTDIKTATLPPPTTHDLTPTPSQTPAASFSATVEPSYTTQVPTEIPLTNQNELFAWAAYWDILNVMDEALNLGDSLGSISFFAAYFDAYDELFVPEEITLLLDEYDVLMADISFDRYITIVNDKINQNGSSTLKDTDLLYSLFESDDSMNEHIEDIITLAVDGGYYGIEIDYEKIRDDLKLWDYFLEFIRRLYIRADEEGLFLRVLLEPSTPFDRIEFPDGPEYVMMCYNLYGNHSGAGPKADAEFIRELVDKMSEVPGKNTFAIATGGFDWGGEDKVVGITEMKALELEEKYSARTRRDEASMCVVFKYKDENRKKHEVWYADSVTLRYWMDIINDCGYYSVAIWRLGGNESLNDAFVE